MKELFKINNIYFYAEDFQDNIGEFEDIIYILQEFQDELKLEKIECVDPNDCCNLTKENYIAELIGVLTEEDDFYTLQEVRNKENEFRNIRLDPFGIQVYKCLNCNKWMINILE